MVACCLPQEYLNFHHGHCNTAAINFPRKWHGVPKIKNAKFLRGLKKFRGWFSMLKELLKPFYYNLKVLQNQSRAFWVVVILKTLYNFNFETYFRLTQRSCTQQSRCIYARCIVYTVRRLWERISGSLKTPDWYTPEGTLKSCLNFELVQVSFGRICV